MEKRLGLSNRYGKISRVRIPVLLSALFIAVVTLPAESLPPDIQADQYLIAAKRQIEAGNFAAATEYFAKILALNVAVPPELYFHYGKTLLKTGQYGMAKDALTRYVTASGRAGQYYQQALELLLEVDEKISVAEKQKAEADAEAARNAEAKRKSQEAMAALHDDLAKLNVILKTYSMAYPLTFCRLTRFEIAIDESGYRLETINESNTTKDIFRARISAPLRAIMGALVYKYDKGPGVTLNVAFVEQPPGVKWFGSSSDKYTPLLFSAENAARAFEAKKILDRIGSFAPVLQSP